MRCVRFERAGLPSDVLQIASVPVPEPSASEVLIRIHARPINPSDTMFVRGRYGIRPQPPQIAGFEAVGTVERCGSAVEPRVQAALLGKRVSFTALGTWCDYACAHAATVVPLPDAISDETGCQLYVNPFTAWAMLHDCMERCGLQSGDWLLQSAGASAFGQMMIQLARLRGIRTISTVRRDDHVPHLLSLGADAVVNLEHLRTTGTTLAARVREIMSENMSSSASPQNSSQSKPSLRCALDAVAGRTGADMLEALSSGGVLYSYGALSLEDIPLNAGIMIFKGLTIRGFWLTEWMKTSSSATLKHVTTSLLELFATNKLSAPVEARYPLDEAVSAVEHAEREGRSGKIVLVG
jgi:NADPH:quinone reductase-like Zn-dependent oxidoreductase